MPKTKSNREARTAVCAFRMTPRMRKKVEAKLKRINARPDGKIKRPVYGVGDFFHAATLALLADSPEVCLEWLADLGAGE